LAQEKYFSSGAVRVLFGCCSGIVRVLFGYCSSLVRVLFESCSGLLRVGPGDESDMSRLWGEHEWENGWRSRKSQVAKSLSQV